MRNRRKRDREREREKKERKKKKKKKKKKREREREREVGGSAGEIDLEKLEVNSGRKVKEQNAKYENPTESRL